MNNLLIGTRDKTEQLLAWADKSFLLIDDGPIAEAFLSRGAKLFDVERHTFNPLRGMDYKQARDFAQILYSANPEGKDTLTVRNGKRALVRLLLEKPTRLDRLEGDERDPGTVEALATVNDILLSPVLRRVLCSPTNFAFKGRVVLRLDRAELGDFDAFVLAALVIGQSKGQVIVPDFGFYGRDTSLIRQNRLVAGVNFLEELSPLLKNAVLLIKDKIGNGCIPEDAAVLAGFEGLTPGTNEYNDFIQHRVSA